MNCNDGTRSVSDFDTENLRLIRQRVSQLLITAAQSVLKDDAILDVAPQDHGGIAPYLKSTDRLVTLDIDPRSQADVIGDLCSRNPALADESFDVVICTEVLEHVRDPFSAVDEIYRVLKKGGRLYASSPFDFRIHGPLPDNWRFTEHGWRVLLNNFREIQITCLENAGRYLMPIHYSVVAIK